MDEGRLNSSTMHTGMAPPQGFALSIFLSKRTHSMFGFLASASAAQAPDGPPPTTATLYFWPAAVMPILRSGWCYGCCSTSIMCSCKCLPREAAVPTVDSRTSDANIVYCFGGILSICGIP